MIAVTSMPGVTLTDAPVSATLPSTAAPKSTLTMDDKTSSPIPGVEYHPLHPTFAAEVTGMDFSNVTQEMVDEIKRALAIVRGASYRARLATWAMMSMALMAVRGAGLPQDGVGRREARRDVPHVRRLGRHQAIRRGPGTNQPTQLGLVSLRDRGVLDALASHGSASNA
jgi:hypothetical protein